MKVLGRQLRKFLADGQGTLSVETALVFPLLLWAYGGTFVFWDAFRAQNVNLKAAYTISDALSRETSAVNEDYLDGLNDIYAFLTDSNHPVRMRVTTIKWDEADNQFEVIWSESTSESWAKHTIATLNANAHQIPAMASGDLAVLVETQMAYEPFLSVVDARIFENFIVTRPRFGPQLVWENDDGTTLGGDDDTATVSDV
ncbi:MAG: pilus assembly protein [Pseudomonadota bacterium]